MNPLESLQLSERQLRVLRVALYAGFGLFAFFVALYASLPRDRMRERLERELSQDPSPMAPLGTGMDVTIGDLGLSLLPPGIKAQTITLKPRLATQPAPPEAGDIRKPSFFFIESLAVRTSLLDLLFGRRGLRFDLSAFSGQASGEAGLSGDEGFARLTAEHLALALLPGLAQALPLPLSGKLDLNVDLKAPLDKRTQRPQPVGAAGLIELKVEDCVLGNGKAKLVVPGDPFLSQGLVFPRMVLGKVSGRAVVNKGRATLSEVHARSPDVEAIVDGYIELRDHFPLSELHLYLRFKPAPAFVQREPKIELMTSALSAMGKRDDGFLGIAITGTAALPQARASRQPPPGTTTTATSTSRPLGMGNAPTAPHPLPVHAPPSAEPAPVRAATALPAPPPAAPTYAPSAPPSGDPPPAPTASDTPPVSPNLQALRASISGTGLDPNSVHVVPPPAAVQAPPPAAVPPPAAPAPAAEPPGDQPANLPSNQKGE